MKRCELELLLVSAGIACVACLPRDRDVGRQQTRTESSSSQGANAEPSASNKAATRTAPGASARPSSATGPANLDQPLTGTFTDSFERPALGRDWRTTNVAGWRIDDGKLCAHRAHNRPAWLARRIPTNAEIEFDATSASADGDIKVEVWGDGRSGATGTSYTNATSYLAIFGGWKNSLHVLARLDEHGDDRHELGLSAESADPRARPVIPSQSYHFRIERRDGQQVRWYVDDIEIHAFDDSEPLHGEGHDHFAFNNWEADVCFDNLRIKALSE
jgi:hypothetical protein